MVLTSRHRIAFHACTILLWGALNTSAASGCFDASIPPQETDNFYEASARLWIPDDAGKVEAVLVLLNGTDSDARPAVSQPEWQAFAKRQNLALLGCHFRGDGESYENASDGSGRALLQMLHIFAEKSDRPELSESPLLFVGHSAGAMFSYNFTCWKPESVLAFVSVKSGPISPTKNVDATKVPGLFIVGESDLAGRVQTTARAYLEAPGEQCLWALALEPQGGHGSSEAIRALIRTYLEDVLTLAKNRVLFATKKDAGEYGMVRQLESPSRHGETGSSVQTTAWLPGHATDRAWQTFVQPVHLVEFADSGGKQENHRNRMAPPTLDLGAIDTRNQTGAIRKTFLLNDPFLPDVSSCVSQDGRLEVVKFEEQEQGQYALTLQIFADQLGPGYLRSSVQFVSRSRSRLSVPVCAQVVTDYSAKPSSLYVGVIPRGRVSEIQIAVASDTGRPLKIESIRSSRPGFALARETEKGKLLCRFDGGQGFGNQSGYFDVILAGYPKKTLKIPFIAWVSKRSTL